MFLLSILLDSFDADWSDCDTDEEVPLDESIVSISDPNMIRVARDCYVDKETVLQAIKWYRKGKDTEEETRPISSMSARYRWIKGDSQMKVLRRVEKRGKPGQSFISFCQRSNSFNEVRPSRI